MRDFKMPTLGRKERKAAPTLPIAHQDIELPAAPAPAHVAGGSALARFDSADHSPARLRGGCDCLIVRLRACFSADEAGRCRLRLVRQRTSSAALTRLRGPCICATTGHGLLGTLACIIIWPCVMARSIRH